MNTVPNVPIAHDESISINLESSLIDANQLGPQVRRILKEAGVTK